MPLHEQCAARGARIVTGLADHPWGVPYVVEMPAATGWHSVRSMPSARPSPNGYLTPGRRRATRRRTG
jgi:hypothetical protein